METKVDIPPRESARAARNNTTETGSGKSVSATPPPDRRATRPAAINSGLLPDFGKPQIDDEDQRLPVKGRRVGGNIGIGILMLALLVGVWWAVAVLGNYPPYILPTPPAVAERLWSTLLDGTLITDFGVTVLEAGLGFLLASVVGIGLGYPIAHSRLLERLLSPYIAISQGLPVVAIAPLLIIWIRDDLARKVIIVALIVFFPILVNTIVGLRSIDRSMYEVARISGANTLQTIRYVEFPLSLRTLLGGVRLGLTLSITGAVIGELIAPRSGLGFLLVQGQNLFDTRLIFVGLVSLAFLAMLAYIGVTMLERVLINWE
jgi:NitT/TauT family transport system permease protein